MADAVGGPRTSRQVTILDAAWYDEDKPTRAVAVAGERATRHDGRLLVQAANGKWLTVEHGQRVVLYALATEDKPRDVGVMDDGEYQRWFG